MLSIFVVTLDPSVSFSIVVLGKKIKITEEETLQRTVQWARKFKKGPTGQKTREIK